ncbi:cleavage and polyadenylation specificity factor subunit 7-like isoform X2 [Dunckerocampus dactyliophorus]|uniref:cleavage and polyadenylation specificity factor subunit 7-like isoform X2 n=1 Tax=Dunckerocampus dactyliophorus TaxID=161453 RepID=UPI0024052C82|nr:cleavage and polyadenylation specificity factor subunit 7-like isoform X2 [Dunckerocampus dactyliophorus]
MHLTSQALGMAAIGPSQSKKGAVYSDSNPSEEDLDINEADDLFDDAVLAGSVEKDKNVTSDAAAGRKTPTKRDDEAVAVKNNEKEKDPSRKFSLYIGHFSWWTSDKDLMRVARKLGVKDIHEIKFAENKTNGQSRGYAKVVVTSEESLKTLLEKIPQCTMDGKSIDCRFATHQNFSVFEDVANKRFPMRSNSRDLDSPEVSSFSRDTHPPSVPTPFPPHPLGNVFPSHSSPFLGQPRPPFPPVPPGILPPPLFPPQAFSVPRQPSPSLHLNPAYFTPPPERHSSHAYSQQKQMSQRGERDYEELLNRNRAVASSAITKAVTGATAGELRVAMETLLTAIAIIKQSSIYRDERCQALVTSLKDCLVSIQGNAAYRSSSHSDNRERERERDRHREGLPSWEGAGTSRRHRERSRSRERDRERLRDRHRDQRDRYR